MTKARILADYVAGGTTATEFDYMDGVTSNVQTQLTAKAPLASPAFSGTPTGITAAHLEAGVLPSDVTGGAGLTALGTVTAGNLSHAGIVYPTASILKVHVFTSHKSSYNVTSTTPVSTGTGTTFTTLARTNAFIIHCKGNMMLYDADGDLPTGATTLWYHSSATATGQAPSGAQIGVNQWLGGYTPTQASGRHDLYLNHHHHEYVSCSGSTSYTFQVFGQMGTDCNYLNMEGDGTGTVMELSI